MQLVQKGLCHDIKMLVSLKVQTAELSCETSCSTICSLIGFFLFQLKVISGSSFAASVI